MQFLICNCYGCSTELLDVREVKSRMCEQHRRMAAKDDSYVGICWFCGNPTAVGSRSYNKKEGEYTIKDKYIMSQGCLECTGDQENNIKWMTIPGETKERVISDVAVVEITHQNNRLFTEYQATSTD